ncbi:MAG: class I SAM-dependent methyltransferase [Phycisphaerales bacterium]
MTSTQASVPAFMTPDAVDHWRAERAYWLDRLGDHYRAEYGRDLDPLQSDDGTAPGAAAGSIQHSAKTNPDAFFATGARAMLFYLRELEDHGVNPTALGAVLDFGMGFGRLTRHWLPLGPELFGSDVTTDAVDFCTRHLGHRVRVNLNGFDPDLPYDDGRFDFVFANSVFTHIQTKDAPGWAEELARILRPGSMAIITALDENVQLVDVPERELDRSLRESNGVYEWGNETVAQNYRYATDAAERRLWSPWFEVLEIRCHFKEQRHVILRRR